MIASRVPNFANKSRAGMSRWFDEMSLRGLMSHPEDRPADIVEAVTGEPLFTKQECTKLDVILSEMFDHFGNDVCEAAYPIFMKAVGLSRTNQ
jgi:hypothetical protein